MRGVASYSSGDVSVWYAANMERNDYGVSGSPVWYEPQDVEVISIEVLGVEVAFESLPKELQDEVLAMAEECDWETEQ